MSRIFIRADASGEIGSGHVMRCITLADDLARRGARVTFICRVIPDVLAAMLRGKGHALRLLPEAQDSRPNDGPPHAHWLGAHWSEDAARTKDIIEECGGADWLVVDHYALDARWEKQLRPQAKRIMVIDDLADREHDCDLLLDQTPGRAEEDYHGLVPDACKLLTGAQYALLRPEFARLRPSAIERRQRQEKVQRILVNFGGSAPEEISRTVLHAIAKAAPAGIIVDFATGATDPQAAGLTALADEMPQQVNFHGFDANMAQLMHDADLAIGAGGVSALERACMGLPGIMFILASNQHDNTRGLQEAGAVLSTPANREEVEKNLKSLLANPGACNKMGGAAAMVTSGLGSSLAALEMLPFTARDGLPVSLVPLNAAHEGLILSWQRQRGIREFSRNPAPPSDEEHANWMRRVLSDPDEMAWIIQNGDTPSGLLRLSRRKNEKWEVGILIGQEQQGKGIAGKALAALHWIFPDMVILAVVHEGNGPSRKLFEKSGYATIPSEPRSPFIIMQRGDEKTHEPTP